jgi:hypothetical protein
VSNTSTTDKGATANVLSPSGSPRSSIDCYGPNVFGGSLCFVDNLLLSPDTYKRIRAMSGLEGECWSPFHRKPDASLAVGTLQTACLGWACESGGRGALNPHTGGAS